MPNVLNAIYEKIRKLKEEEKRTGITGTLLKKREIELLGLIGLRLQLLLSACKERNMPPESLLEIEELKRIATEEIQRYTNLGNSLYAQITRIPFVPNYRKKSFAIRDVYIEILDKILKIVALRDAARRTIALPPPPPGDRLSYAEEGAGPIHPSAGIPAFRLPN